MLGALCKLTSVDGQRLSHHPDGLPGGRLFSLFPVVRTTYSRTHTATRMPTEASIVTNDKECRFTKGKSLSSREICEILSRTTRMDFLYLTSGSAHLPQDRGVNSPYPGHWMTEQLRGNIGGTTLIDGVIWRGNDRPPPTPVHTVLGLMNVNNVNAQTTIVKDHSTCPT